MKRIFFPQLWIIGFLLLFMMSSFVHGKSDDDSSSSNDPACVILFMFFGLCSGIIVTQVLSRYGEAIPYTVVIFIIGVLCSLISKLKGGGILGDSINQWVNIDAEIIVFVFLPPLVFGEAMNLNWHHVQGAFFPACLLAGPGVLLGCILMGIFVKFAIPYQWSWNLSMCFGSIVASTDTVAVISLLKSAEASQKITMLIAGESLLNDGTSMVLFLFFYRMLCGVSFDVAQVIIFTLSSILGSGLLGIVSGLIIVYWLRSANRQLKEIDVYIQISITLCSAYLIFFVSQYVLRISGVLTCCGAGVMLAWLAPPIILSRESMHSVWSIVEWMGNTLIFLLAGLIIGHRTLEHVSPMDWLYALELYLVLMIIRSITLACAHPWLRISNHQCTIRESVFITWAGLRGAISIALALIVENSKLIQVSSEETSRILFYVGIIAAMTLLVNGTFAKKILDYFELIDDSAMEKELVMNAIKIRLRKKMNKVLNDISIKLNTIEIEEIRMSCSLLRDVKNKDAIYQDNEDKTFISSLNPLVMRSPRNSMIFDSRNPTPKSIDLQQHSNKFPDMLLDNNTESNDFTSYLRNNSTTTSFTRPMVDNTLIQPLYSSIPNEDDDQDIEAHDVQSQQQEQQQQQQNKNKNITSNSISIDIPRRISSTSLITERVGFDFVKHRRASLTNNQTHSISTSTRTFSNYIFPSNNTIMNDQIQNRIANVSRLLSQDRGINAILSNDLLAYVRGIFLEIVRVKYWQNIDRGKLPRLSHSAQFLLYSVDVGLDELRSTDGLQDWQCIEQHIISKSYLIRILNTLYLILPNWSCFSFITRTLGRLEANRDKRNYYILTSFIEAHEHAQKKIHSFIGIEEDEQKDNRSSNSNNYHHHKYKHTVKSNPLNRSEIRYNKSERHDYSGQKNNYIPVGATVDSLLCSHRNGENEDDEEEEKKQEKDHLDDDDDDDHHDDHDHDDDTSIACQLSPEEIKVKLESENTVRSAKLLLSMIPIEIQSSIARKQIARTILAKEAEMVKNMMKEGLLSSRHAQEFLEEIGSDVARIEKQRNDMYREHAQMSAKMFEERKSNISRFHTTNPLSRSMRRSKEEKSEDVNNNNTSNIDYYNYHDEESRHEPLLPDS